MIVVGYVVMIMGQVGRTLFRGSIDLSNLHRPRTVPAHPLLPTFALAGDPFLQPVGPTQPLPSEATPIGFF